MLAIRKPHGAIRLADNAQWTERFEIRSETSNRIYIVSRNKKSGKYGCSCPAYKTRRYCKHLYSMGLRDADIHGNGEIQSKKQIAE